MVGGAWPPTVSQNINLLKLQAVLLVLQHFGKTFVGKNQQPHTLTGRVETGIPPLFERVRREQLLVIPEALDRFSVLWYAKMSLALENQPPNFCHKKEER